MNSRCVLERGLTSLVPPACTWHSNDVGSCKETDTTLAGRDTAGARKEALAPDLSVLIHL